MIADENTYSLLLTVTDLGHLEAAVESAANARVDTMGESPAVLLKSMRIFGNTILCLNHCHMQRDGLTSHRRVT